LAGIFTLSSEDQNKLNSCALKRLNDWRTDIVRTVPQLEQFTIDEINADVNAYLDDVEKGTLEKNITEVAEWLRTCMDIGTGYSDYPFSTNIIGPMLRIKSLLIKVYERKTERARKEQQKREEEHRWQIAFKALNPPLQNARIYLNPNDYKAFEGSIHGAVDAYLAKGGSYVSDSGAETYCQWCSTIRNRQEEKQRGKVAERKSWEYNHALSEEVEKLRSMLYPEKQNPEAYFEKKIVDLRYMGQSFDHLLSDDEKQSLDTVVNRITSVKLGELASHIYHQFVDWEYQVSYFLLPRADYSFENVPCLDFSFDVFAIVEAEVWLKPSQISFDEYMFTLPQIEHKCGPYASYFTELKEPELLGYHYLLFTPDDLGYLFWQTIPLVLVAGLINGETEPTGTTVLGASGAETVYSVQNSDEEVTIPESFMNYLKEVGGTDQMMAIGILDEKVANIVNNSLKQPGEDRNMKSSNNKEAPAFGDEELISSLTTLGVPVKDAENLLELTPRSLALPEAIELALQKYSEIIEQRHSLTSE